MSIIQKVRNWKDYNRSLKKRGAIIFSFDEKYYCESVRVENRCQVTHHVSYDKKNVSTYTAVTEKSNIALRN
jgi:hypothetical protein